jgi:hypothetical protein
MGPRRGFARRMWDPGSVVCVSPSAYEKSFGGDGGDGRDGGDGGDGRDGGDGGDACTGQFAVLACVPGSRPIMRPRQPRHGGSLALVP